MDWLAVLKSYKNVSGKTYADISRETGIPLTTIEKLFCGRTKDPKIGMMSKIAHCLGCTIDELAGAEQGTADVFGPEERRIISLYRSLDKAGKDAANAFLEHEAERVREARAAAERRERALYPKLYYDLPVSAGTGEYLDDSTAVIVGLENEPPAGTDYILRIAGNSMEPEFSNGDLVFVRRAEELEYGEIGIFVYSGSVYMKQYTPEGLRSLNPDYPLIPGSRDIRCIGLVLGAVRGAVERMD